MTTASGMDNTLRPTRRPASIWREGLSCIQQGNQPNMRDYHTDWTGLPRLPALPGWPPQDQACQSSVSSSSLLQVASQSCHTNDLFSVQKAGLLRNLPHYDCTTSVTMRQQITNVCGIVRNCHSDITRLPICHITLNHLRAGTREKPRLDAYHKNSIPQKPKFWLSVQKESALLVTEREVLVMMYSPGE